MITKKKIIGMLVVLFLVGHFTACRKDYTFNPANVVITTPVSFQGEVMPVFTAKCSTVPNTCHAGNTPPLGLDLTAANAYSSLFAKGEIDTLNAETSKLYQKIKTGGSMATFISADETSKIFTWIKQGAKNN